MKHPKVIVIDYGVGNLLSVQRALEYCGAEVDMTNQASAILTASRVVLPGVGAFSNAMAELKRLQLVEVIQEVAQRGIPLLGICLGMQLLLDESEEFGLTQGLSLIPGRVVPVPNTTKTGQPQKIPHIGWNSLVMPPYISNWQNTILRMVEPGEATYFVHSFMANPLHMNHRLADCLYGGVALSAVIGKDNICGCQFHPEKSGEVGLRILRQFLA
jgi:glutamine amidotransferase